MLHEIPVAIEYASDYCDSLIVSTHTNAQQKILAMIDYMNKEWYEVDDLCLSLKVKHLAGSCNGVQEDGSTLDPYRDFRRGNAIEFLADLTRFKDLQIETQGNKIFPVHTDTFVVLYNEQDCDGSSGMSKADTICGDSSMSAANAATEDLTAWNVAHEIAHTIYGKEHVAPRDGNGMWLMEYWWDDSATNDSYVGFSPETKAKMVNAVQTKYYIQEDSTCATTLNLDDPVGTLLHTWRYGQRCTENSQCRSGICNEGHNGMKLCDDYQQDQIGAFCSVDNDMCVSGSSCNGRGVDIDKTGRCQNEAVAKGAAGSWCWHDGLCDDGFECLRGICVDKNTFG